MFSRASALILVVVLAVPAAAQVQMRPASPPLVTAENEAWYLNGEPITYGGHYFYPAGALVFFNANEMVRSGFYFGVPLFTRTTLEPFSIVYVPVGRGLMQPYERPRSGDLAGTVGSRTPAFPVSMTMSGAGAPAQAAGPPMLGDFPVIDWGARPVSPRPDIAPPVGTTGTAPSQQYAPAHVRIGGQPSGLNAIYLEYQGTRWFSTGTTIDVDPKTAARLGEYHGFPIWRGRDADEIYVATARSGSLAVPYSRHRAPADKMR